MTEVLANIIVYPFLVVILGSGAIGTFRGWRDDRARRGKNVAHRPDGAGATPRQFTAGTPYRRDD
jgi:hypothetical protein